MASALPEVTWLEDLFTKLNVPIINSITIRSDNKFAVQLEVNPIFQERKKYIEIDCHFIRDKIKTSFVKSVYVPIQLNTKWLAYLPRV